MARTKSGRLAVRNRDVETDDLDLPDLQGVGGNDWPVSYVTDGRTALGSVYAVGGQQFQAVVDSGRIIGLFETERAARAAIREFASEACGG